jgi:hypothetical protein
MVTAETATNGLSALIFLKEITACDSTAHVNTKYPY